MAFILYKQSTAQEKLLCLRYPYRPLLQDYLSHNPHENFITSLYCYKSLVAKPRKAFDWDEVIEDVRSDSKFESTNEKYFKSVTIALMTLLYEFDCDCMTTVFCIIVIYFYAKLGPEYQISAEPDKIFEGHKECCEEQREAIFRCQILHNAYIFNSIHLADRKFLQVLLRYGLQCLPSIDEYEIAKDTAEKFAKWMSDEYHNNPTIMWEEVKANLKSYLGAQEKFWRRKFDVIKGLEAVMRKRGQCRSLSRYVECVNLYFESVPEPFITKREVKKLILTLMRGHNYIGIHETVEGLCKDFVELFPDSSTEFYCPRKLQHICRCKIRKTLNYTDSFPKSTELLFEKRLISYAMSDYILCQMPEK